MAEFVSILDEIDDWLKINYVCFINSNTCTEYHSIEGILILNQKYYERLCNKISLFSDWLCVYA